MKLISPRASRWVTRGAGACVLAWAAGAQAQVQYFDRVPTPDEIQAALGVERSPAGPGVSADAAPLFKTRGLEWSAPAKAALPGSEGAAQGRTELGGPALALPVNFELGAARVSRTSVGYIEAMVASLERNPGMRLAVEGHTDAVGPPRANLMLSWERAFSVFRLMVERYGIDPTRLQPAGKGSSEPLVPTEQSSRVNRRVQFRVLS